MDPTTVVLLLALNLISVGLLLALIGRRMDLGRGTPDFAAGTLLFGAAYMLRLATGHQASHAYSLLPDAAMFTASAMFVSGLCEFGGLPAWRRRRLALGVLGFAALWCAGWWTLREVGRHAVLNLALATNYLLLSSVAGQAWRQARGDMRLSLTVLALVMGALGIATALRGVVVLTEGLWPLFNGTLANLYYGYSTFVSVVLGPNLLWMVFLRLNGQLQDLATHDPLTGLLNRHGLDQALRRHFAARPPAPLVLCLFDIDHFKRINDQHGHAAGDTVLRAVAQALSGQVRGMDFVARLGGEEFLVGCVGGEDAALALAERVREAVGRGQVDIGQAEPRLRCTLSAGVSPAFQRLAQWESALKLADQALYDAKAAGRNTVRAQGSGRLADPGA
jgi:diguanylate cyclase (GGDEF)-like protein